MPYRPADRLVRALVIVGLLAAGCSSAQLRTACIGAGAADAATTAVGISNGATEANPFMKPAPAALSLVGTALAVWAGDQLRRRGFDRTADWFYGGCAVLHGSAAAWNARELSR